ARAAAVALAARLRGIDALIVMPDDASAVKVAAVKSYGATIHTCAPGEAARTAAVNALQAEQPRTFVHPYDNHHIISGQGTAALEMLEDYAGLDTLVAPIGGGGLLAGTALAATTRNGIRCFGAEPAQADDAKRSFDAGRIIPVEHPETIADGLRTSVGVRNFPIIREHVSDILTVSEDGIVAAMRLIWERMKLVVEPSGAVPLAALLENGAPIETQSIGLIISGGNTDLDALPWLKRR
ncbi:MAG: pyridoxal-phosphate dependent enzyme, partial [Chromatiales bacterium]|nr:pyridoxal-phosphate dependent enzyme [Chromatiales bacterium]